LTPDRAFAGGIVGVGVRAGLFGRPVVTIDRAAMWVSFDGVDLTRVQRGSMGMRDARTKDLPELLAFLAKQEGRWTA